MISSLVTHISQSEDQRHQVAVACRKDLKDITKDCIEIGAAFICLKVEKPYRIPKPVPEKTLRIIGLGPLNTVNGMFREVNLTPGGIAIVYGDKLQEFDGNKEGGGPGIVPRIKFPFSS